MLQKIRGSLLLAAILSFANLAVAAETIAIPDNGWRLWPDAKATWQNDTLYLPDEAANISKLPVNAPTGGWDALTDQQGVPVSLPATVEQYFWGDFGFRQCTPDEYGYAAGSQKATTDPAKLDADAQNGNYKGVSWWWRSIDVPASFGNRIAILHIRGARLRAEVFVNRQLVGYDLIGETSFDCEVTKAIRPGESNQIAVRITNPGGRLDWIDFLTMNWGNYTIPATHGFGGLDRGITLTAHDPVYLDDTWALNTPAVHTINAHSTIRNTTGSAWEGTVRFDVTEPASDAVLATESARVRVEAGAAADVEVPVSYAEALPWDLNSPHLYTLHAHLISSDASKFADDATRTFGFRWFEPRGIGAEAGLYLNGERIRLYTAISWGYWGLNGLWPTPDLAEKEVRDAKQLNLNMLNFHRNIGKEEVLARQDELGLLRYMEPGGGGGYIKKLSRGEARPTSFDNSGSGGEPTTFLQKYLEAKVTRMVRQFRSHPSLVIYVLQNETEPDFGDPHMFYLVRRVHELDPSRVVAAKSGISPNNEAWFAPYEPEIRTDDGKGFSGWRDQHTVGGPGVWQDDLYLGPNKFTHQINDRKQIVDWGEMLGAAVPDNHPQMIQQIQSLGGKSYDLQVHQNLAAVYEQFFKKWGFTAPFPTGDAFFHDLGNKEYEFWGRVIETARLSESNDILSISGWESTAIENHSGLVDNLRNFHGDPALLAPKLAPLLPVVETKQSVLNTGDAALFDVYLLNESGRPAAGNLIVTLKDPTGTSTEVARYPVPDFTKDRFVYEIATDIKTPALATDGNYTLEISLDSDPKIKNSRPLLAVRNIASEIPAAKIAVIGDDASAAIKRLSAFPKLTAEAYQDGQKYDLILAASATTTRKLAPMDTGAPGRTALSQSADPTAVLTPTVLQSIHSGTPLLVLAGDDPHGSALAKELASAGALEFSGSVPTARASWMGNWIFLRSHPLYNGLPVNEVMKGDYQISVRSCYGLLVDGPDVQIIAGYGRDHDRNLGAATFTTKLSGTPIVFQTVNGMHSVIEQRFLANALNFLLSQRR
jgi:hypothetical protein